MAEAVGKGSEGLNSLKYNQFSFPAWVWRKSCNLEIDPLEPSLWTLDPLYMDLIERSPTSPPDLSNYGD